MTIATFGTLMDIDNCAHKLLYSMSFDFSFSYTTGKKNYISHWQFCYDCAEWFITLSTYHSVLMDN